MFKRLLLFAFILIHFVFCFVGCDEKTDVPPIQPLNNRTILVYMLADNDLGYYYDYDTDNINAMCEAFANKNIDGRLLIFHSETDEQPCLKEIYKPATNKPCSIKILQTYPDCNTTDTATVERVMEDVKRLAPSSSYGIVFWSHATGWLPQNRFYSSERREASSSFGREGEEGRTIDIDLLAKSLRNIHFNFMLFDACMMGSVEVAYELRNVCDYIVATPTETLGDGFPYKEITPMFFEKEINYKEICNRYYDTFIAPGTYECGTIALINTLHLERLADICAEIVQGKTEEIRSLPIDCIQWYDRQRPHVFYDLGDYIQHLTGDDTVAYNRFIEQLDKTVEYKATSSKFFNLPISHFSGLSCYIPFSSNDIVTEDYYKKLQWYNKLYNNF